MLLSDSVKLALGAVIANRMRSLLTILGITVGIASVVLLTSIGEGLHRFVLNEFSQFGTNLIYVSPGKTTTHGGSGAVISNVRPLTIDDAKAMERIPNVVAAVPIVQGNAEVEFDRRKRRTTVLGVGADTLKVWQVKVAFGKFLPADDPRSARAFAVLGSKVRDELFRGTNPLGQIVRIGGNRFRVIGVMESKGQLLGFDLDDAVYIPTAKSLEMFDRESVMEIDLLHAPGTSAEDVKARVTQLLKARHGEEDFTVVTQEQMLDVLSSVLDMLTLAVGALGGISLLVGGIGILTIMTIAVKERTAEIGLLRAIGAGKRQILWLFLGEALTLSAIGGLAGLVIGWGSAQLLHLILPGLPAYTPWNYALMAVGLAVAIGLLAGVIPARRAAGMDPVEALRAE